MTSALVQTGAATVGSALAVSGVSIIAVQRIRRRRVVGSALAQRWMTWAVLGPLWLAASAWGPGRLTLLTAFAVISAAEYVRLRPSMSRADRWILVGCAALSIPAMTIAGLDSVTVLTTAVLAGIVAPIVEQDVRSGTQRIGAHVVGTALIIAPFVLLQHVAADISTAAFFTVGLATAFSDVFAFVAGSTLGHRPLAPILSPAKTFAGAIGNLLGAATALAIAVATGMVGPAAMWMAPVVAVGAITGDLLVSLFKRARGVKDAGSWLPGFGGLLDRVDSLLVTSLLVFVVLSTTGGIA
jgi:phosphatidate cytidylyltransferase